MNYFSPERSTTNGFPCYLSPEGKAIAALQFPYLRPLPKVEGLAQMVMLTVFLRTGRKSYSAFHHECAVVLMAEFTERWIEDPEFVLKYAFKYDFNYSDDFDLEPAASGGGTTTVKLEDLDL